MASAGVLSKEELLAAAREYLEHGRKVITINADKKPTLEKWTPLRDMNISIEQVNQWLSSPLAERIAILLDNSLLAFDYDGAGEYMFWDKLVPRCSPELQTAFHHTTFTKTPHGGHVLFSIDPDNNLGVKELEFWHNGKEHNQALLLSQNEYLVERDIGYQAIRGIKSLLKLTQTQLYELLSLIQLVRSKTNAIKTSVNVLQKHYYNTNRDRLTFGLSGFLHKGGVGQSLINDLQECLMDTLGIDTAQERQERFNVIKNTCARDRSSAEVSGRTRLLEAIDNDESILVIIQKAFRPLGYFKEVSESATNQQSNESKSTKRSEEKEKEKVRREYVQMYSNKDVLAEAVLIKGRPYFAIVDLQSKVIKLEKEIKLDDAVAGEKKATILRPAEADAYINKAHYFESEDAFFECVENAKQQTLDSLYRTTKSIWSKYIDADDNHLSICAADTIFTYFQDAIGMTHYLFFVGDNDSGKSNNLVVFHCLGYRNLMSIGVSAANIYQYLGSRNEGVGTICEDEANEIEEDSDKMDIAKSGYTKGYPVVKITITPFGRVQQRYFTFCFKVYSAERTPDPIKAKGLLQRIIKLKCVAGNPKHDILEVVNPWGDEQFQILKNELDQWHNLLLCYRLVHCNDAFPDIQINLKNREKQLLKPVLRLFQNTKTFDYLCDVMSTYVNERRGVKVNSLHAFICEVVKSIIEEESYNNIIIASAEIVTLEPADIWAKFKARTCSQEIPGRPLSVETAEFGTISQRRVTSIIEDILKAKYTNSNGSRALHIDKIILQNVLDTYSNSQIRIERSVQKDSADSAHSADRGSVSKSTEKDAYSENAQKHDDNYEDLNKSDDDDENNEKVEEQ